MPADRIINVGGHYFESIAGNARVQVGPVIHFDRAQQLAQEITPESPREEILKLLAAIHHELTQLDLPDDVKGEALHEVEGAAMQTQKTPPDKKKVAQKLKDALERLKEAGKLSKAVTGVTTLILKIIEWAVG